MIGAMMMPVDFGYRDVFLKGQPKHQKYDDFSRRHPPMDQCHRAKIFAPFDALAGFSDAIESKEVLYEDKRELSDEQKEELDRRVGILYRLTCNGNLARDNHVQVTITYYVPCADKNSSSYGSRGRYVTADGICKKMGMNTMRVDNTVIPLKNISNIESSKEIDGVNIFHVWEADSV